MIEVAVGIDIGTTYTKGVALINTGKIIAVKKKFTSIKKIDLRNNLVSTAEFWNDFKEVLLGLVNKFSNQKTMVSSICISAIAPTITVFDESNPINAFSIMYSSLPNSKIIESKSFNMYNLTFQRLKVLRTFALKNNFINPRITDLVGYINWMLTGRLTINGISLSLMGLGNNKNDCSSLTIIKNHFPKLVSISEQIGETDILSQLNKGIPVCGGCPDTIGSIIGAGLEREGDKMIYLGTFGSFLELKTNVGVLLNAKKIIEPPFKWLLSIPDFGSQIESLSKEWFGNNSTSKNLQLLDQSAETVPYGANGTLFLLPRWKGLMKTVGDFNFIPNLKAEFTNNRDKHKALLESIAYAILALGLQLNDSTYVSGGGAKSKIWIDTISTILNKKLVVRNQSWNASGVADIAAYMIWGTMNNSRSFYISRIDKDFKSKTIMDNIVNTKKYYYEKNWL